MQSKGTIDAAVPVLRVASVARAGGGWDLYLRVGDARVLREAVRSKVPEVGAIVLRPYGCREFEVTDPDGHVLVLGRCG